MDELPVIGNQSVHLARPAREGGGSTLALMRTEGGGRAAGGRGQGFTAELVLRTISHWWKVALPIGVILGCAAGAAVWFLVKPRWEASAWLEIRGSAQVVAFELHDSQDRAGGFVATQIELMKSPIVLAPVLSKQEIREVPEIAREPDKVRWLGQSLIVTQVRRSDLYTVSFVCSNPADSAAVVNEVVEVYFKHQDVRDSARVKATAMLLEAERTRREMEVGRLQEDVRAATKAATGKDPFAAILEPDPFRQGPLVDLQKTLANAEVDRRVLEAEVNALEELLKKEAPSVPQSVIEEEVEQNQELRAKRNALAAARFQLEELKKVVNSEDHPEYKKKVAEIQEKQSVLESAKAALRQQVSGDVAKTVAMRRIDHLAERRQHLDAIQIREGLLRDQVKKEKQNVLAGTGDMLAANFKRAELDQAQRVLDLITSRLAQIRTEQNAPSRVSKLWSAEPPTAPLPFPYYLLVFVSACGVCLPMGAAVLWERMVRRISEPRQLESETQLAVVGEVAPLPSRRRRAGSSLPIRVAEDIDLFEESVDTLRTSLLLAEDLKGMRVLTVTSAVSHEGKTSVAVSLAVSLARASGQPTLLIDGDMRSPDVHKLFEVPLEPGLAEVLDGRASLDEAIVTTRSSSVHVLAAGKLRTSPHQLLGNGKIGSLIQEVRGRYRYVVIDTPPVLVAAESLLLTKMADTCLLCAMRNVTRGDQVRKASDRVLASGSRVAGAVLNGVPRGRYEYRRRSYHYPRNPA